MEGAASCNASKLEAYEYSQESEPLKLGYY